MGKQILETNNYSKFELTEFNRDIGKTKELEESMKKYGFLDPYPLHVSRNGNGKLKIKAGHHRFYVAQKLGIPVKYVESRDEASIFELERGTNPWKIKDYLAAYCRQGRPNYLKVRDYCDETGINLQAAISMLAGQDAGSGNHGPAFKMGKYKIKENCSHAAQVRDIVLLLKRLEVPFYSTSLLVRAISKCLWAKEFSVSQFKSKAKAFPFLFVKKANLDQYLDLIEEIYNRRSRQKVPVKFLAQEAADRRAKDFFGKE